ARRAAVALLVALLVAEVGRPRVDREARLRLRGQLHRDALRERALAVLRAVDAGRRARHRPLVRLPEEDVQLHLLEVHGEALAARHRDRAGQALVGQRAALLVADVRAPRVEARAGICGRGQRDRRALRDGRTAVRVAGEPGRRDRHLTGAVAS